MRTKLFALSLAGLIASIGTAQAATEIQFWHSMEGALGERVNALVKDFNASQSDYQVKASYKGNYGESMNAGVAAFRAGNAPDILQVFEVGTATMMAAKGAIQPVQEMSEKVGKPINPGDFLGAVAGYYSSNEGKLISMPFNSSTPVLYYNKDAFKKAGLDAEKPPKTWQELHEAAKKLRESGQECGYTSSWPSWILLENFAAWHNIPFASENNGFGGPSARLQLDNPLFLKHLTFLADMSKDGSFSYGGRGDTANALFTSGKCGMFTGSSGNRANIIKTGEFEFGTSSLPYYSDVQGAPQNSIIGGASLWVFAKKSDDVYKGVTEFFHFISSRNTATIPTEGENRNNHSTPATAVATAYGQISKLRYSRAPRITRFAITARTSATTRPSTDTASENTAVVLNEAIYSELLNSSAKLSRPTNCEDRPKGSSK
jgi:sn-glycerol 3-phosphate transport system substrate-binding protein